MSPAEERCFIAAEKVSVRRVRRYGSPGRTQCAGERCAGSKVTKVHKGAAARVKMARADSGLVKIHYSDLRILFAVSAKVFRRDIESGRGACGVPLVRSALPQRGVAAHNSAKIFAYILRGGARG